MRNTEYNAKSAVTPKTGLFASLCARLHAEGIDASKIGQGNGAPSSRRAAVTMAALVTTLVALTLTATPALAAAPETPELTVKPVFASVAVFNGTLSPKGLVPAEGTYKFLYKASKTECVGGSETAAGLALGGAPETLPSEQVKGLTPSIEYTACLEIENESITAKSAPVTFKTTAAAKPEAPEATEATERKAMTATLNGVVNPLKEGEPGKYRFLYKQSASTCTGETETTEEEAPGTSPLPVSVAVGGLEGGKPYTFCVEAFNALGEATLSAPKTFETTITPETPTSLEANPIAANTATLNGTLNSGNAGNPGTYEFIYRQSSTECQGEGEKHAPEPAEHATGAEKEPAIAPITGLLPHTAYTFCLQAANEVGEATLSAPVTFTTLAAPPRVEEQFTTEVASTSVTLNAKLNPQGAATTYTFELAPAGGSFAPVAEPEGSGSIPAGIEGVPLSVHVQHGLAPNTAYELRLVAHNSIETVSGEPAVSFTTERTGGALALPDNRQWEMVTPPDKHGALFYAWQGAYNADTQVSVHGDAIVDEESAPSDTEPQAYNNEIMVLSTRGPGGWSSESLGVPRSDSSGPGVAGSKEYHFFSEDLSRGLVGQRGNFTPLSPEASEQTPYIHADYLNGNPAERCESSYLTAGSCYRPLVSGCPAAPAECKPGIKEHADVPPGTEFGEETDNKCKIGGQPCGPTFLDASPDMSHVILQENSGVPLTPTPASNYYEWSEGQLQSLPAPLAGAETKGRLGFQNLELHAISRDGRRVILENGEGESEQLLLRVNSTMAQSPLGAKGECTVPVDACSIQINENQGGSGNSGDGIFQVASSDDSRVFFLDESRLTSGATAESREPDLYEYDLDKPAGERLSDLSVGQSGPVDVTEVLGASEDGSYVYFEAAGTVAGTGAHPSACNTGASEQAPLEALTCNVYVRHDGVTRLVAPAGPLYESAQVSPDGRFLEFMSDKDLTGYDTRDALSGKADLEVYEYDAETGRLACASCNPTGARPTGTELNTKGSEAELEGVESAKLGGWMAAGIPTWHNLNRDASQLQYEVRDVSDSGRVFFDSSEALVPQDINAREDVYEYEPAGVGGCTVESPIYGGRSGGCASLISSGTSSQDSAFLGSSEGGGDVFFVTTSKLAPADYDDAFDVYDAHVCTSDLPCPSPAGESPPPCDTEASCKAAPTPQPEIYGVPSSATFSGPGNQTPLPSAVVKKTTKKTAKCKRGFLKNKQGKCIKNRKKSKHKAKKSAHTNRRAQ